MGSAPDQAPEALQEVAFVADQLSVALAPLATVLGLAVTLTVGTGVWTATFFDCPLLPPGPLHVSV